MYHLLKDLSRFRTLLTASTEYPLRGWHVASRETEQKAFSLHIGAHMVPHDGAHMMYPPQLKMTIPLFRIHDGDPWLGYKAPEFELMLRRRTWRTHNASLT